MNTQTRQNRSFTSRLAHCAVRFALGSAALLSLSLLPSARTQAQGNAVPGFLPSTRGFRFVNNFSPAPYNINVGGINVPIGSAANGVCGGMAFAARDYFQAHLAIPSRTTAPPPNSVLFDYLSNRLFDSFELPVGPARYMYMMSPALPDNEVFLAPHGRAYIMMQEEWPKIKYDIDHGKLSPMALIRIKSANPFDLGKNHQVLAYRYQVVDGNRLRIYVYDPNFPMDNNVFLTIPLTNANVALNVTYSRAATRTICFFRSTYHFKNPPPLP